MSSVFPCCRGLCSPYRGFCTGLHLEATVPTRTRTQAYAPADTPSPPIISRDKQNRTDRDRGRLTYSYMHTYMHTYSKPHVYT